MAMSRPKKGMCNTMIIKRRKDDRREGGALTPSLLLLSTASRGASSATTIDTGCTQRYRNTKKGTWGAQTVQKTKYD